MKNNSTHEFERLLGRSALALWPDLPRDVQENLFETAVGDDDIVRNHLGVLSARPSSKNGASDKAGTSSLSSRILVPVLAARSSVQMSRNKIIEKLNKIDQWSG